MLTYRSCTDTCKSGKATSHCLLQGAGQNLAAVTGFYTQLHPLPADRMYNGATTVFPLETASIAYAVRPPSPASLGWTQIAQWYHQCEPQTGKQDPRRRVKVHARVLEPFLQGRLELELILAPHWQAWVEWKATIPAAVEATLIFSQLGPGLSGVVFSVTNWDPNGTDSELADPAAAAALEVRCLRDGRTRKDAFQGK